MTPRAFGRMASCCYGTATRKIIPEQGGSGCTAENQLSVLISVAFTAGEFALPSFVWSWRADIRWPERCCNRLGVRRLHSWSVWDPSRGKHRKQSRVWHSPAASPWCISPVLCCLCGCLRCWNLADIAICWRKCRLGLVSYIHGLIYVGRDLWRAM